MSSNYSGLLFGLILRMAKYVILRCDYLLRSVSLMEFTMTAFWSLSLKNSPAFLLDFY